MTMYLIYQSPYEQLASVFSSQYVASVQYQHYQHKLEADVQHAISTDPVYLPNGII
jgi:hypothetical protein